MNENYYHDFEPGPGPGTCGVMAGGEPCLRPKDSDLHRPTTLAEVLPREFSGAEYEDSLARKYSRERVTVQWDARVKPWPGHHKNVSFWYELQNGYAVGFNENPQHGWSFPILRMR